MEEQTKTIQGDENTTTQDLKNAADYFLSDALEQQGINIDEGDMKKIVEAIAKSVEGEIAEESDDTIPPVRELLDDYGQVPPIQTFEPDVSQQSKLDEKRTREERQQPEEDSEEDIPENMPLEELPEPPKPEQNFEPFQKPKGTIPTPKEEAKQQQEAPKGNEKQESEEKPENPSEEDIDEAEEQELLQQAYDYARKREQDEKKLPARRMFEDLLKSQTQKQIEQIDKEISRKISPLMMARIMYESQKNMLIAKNIALKTQQLAAMSASGFLAALSGILLLIGIILLLVAIGALIIPVAGQVFSSSGTFFRIAIKLQAQISANKSEIRSLTDKIKKLNKEMAKIQKSGNIQKAKIRSGEQKRMQQQSPQPENQQ